MTASKEDIEYEKICASFPPCIACEHEADCRYCRGGTGCEFSQRLNHQLHVCDICEQEIEVRYFYHEGEEVYVGYDGTRYESESDAISEASDIALWNNAPIEPVYICHDCVAYGYHMVFGEPLRLRLRGWIYKQRWRIMRWKNAHMN